MGEAPHLPLPKPWISVGMRMNDDGFTELENRRIIEHSTKEITHIPYG
jgi:hypothetical protein